MIGGIRTNVRCSYALKSKSVYFRVERYDRGVTLVIDPTLIFDRLFSPNYGLPSLAADQDGNIYLATLQGVMKRDMHGTILWTATINGQVAIPSVAVDSAHNVYVAGAANSSSFPTTPGSFPIPTESDFQPYGFVTKLSPDGSQLLYSTLLGSSQFGADGVDQVTALAVSPDGQITLAGTLFSLKSFSPGQFPSRVRERGGFVARLSAEGTEVIYSTAIRGLPSNLAVDASGNSVVAGAGPQADDAPISLQPSFTDVTLYITADSGATVQSYRGAPINLGIAIDPVDPLSLIRATTAGVFQSFDGGITWQLAQTLGAEAYSTVWIHPKKPQLRYASPSAFAGSSPVLFRSEDQGVSWRSVPAPGSFSSFFDAGDRIFGRVGNNAVYAVYVSNDDGNTWERLSLPATLTVCCTVDPLDPQHFLFGPISGSFVGQGVWETRDGGTSFRVLSQDQFLPLALDPQMAGVVYGYQSGFSVRAGYYVLRNAFAKSEDGGRTWRYPSSGAQIPAAQIAVDPSGSGRLYIFGALGLWRSDDRGETWTQASGQLGNAPLYAGAVRFGDLDRVYAISFSQGDAYLAKLDATGSFVFSTLVGGRNSDKIQSIAIASNGDVLIGGVTQSDDLLAAAGAPVKSTGGYEQGFLARISADGSALKAFRYIGGGSTDSIVSIGLLSSGELAVAGNTASLDQPDVTTDALQPRISGDFDGFVGVFSTDRFATRYFSFLGVVGIQSMVTTGMRADLLGFVLNQHFGGTTLTCEDPNVLTCFALLAGIDLTP